jgi:flagellar FliL protein
MTMLDAATQTAEIDLEEAPHRSRKKLLLVVLVLLVAAAGAGYWFVLRPAPDAPPEPGAVMKLDAIQVNLAQGHYLRVGIALQASKDAAADLDGSKALDTTIALFSGQDMDRLQQTPYRNRLKQTLERRLDKEYDGEVIGVYFTDFVTQ